MGGTENRSMSRATSSRCSPTGTSETRWAGRAEDPGGHHWTFSQSIADVDPAEWGGVLVAGELD